MAALHAAALPPGWSAASIAASMQTPGTETLVFRDPDVTGLIMVRTAADEAEILTVAVAVDTRRRGAGRALLAAAGRHAQAQGAVRLHLEVASSNEGALKFYADAGFIQIGRRAQYYPDGADALLMSKVLA